VLLQNLLPGFLSGEYFGISIYSYILFLVTIILSIILGKAAYYFIKKYGRKLAEKTENEFDDVLIDIIQEPVVLMLFVIGMVVGYQFLGIESDFINATFYNIVGTLVIVVLAWFSVRLVDAIIIHFVVPITKKTKSKLDDQLVPILSKLSKAGILIIAGVIILSNFGYDVTALIAGLGIGGLAVALAAKDTLSNVFGGMSIFASRPFNVGDWIKLGDLVGEVKEVGLRTTKVKNLEDRIVTMPNSKLSDATIENISSSPTRKMRMHLGLVYGASAKTMRLAEKLLGQIINKHPGCRNDPDIYFMEFKDSCLDLFLIYHIEDKKNWMRIKSDINYAIKEAFDRNKIGFAFPSQSIYLEK